MGWPAPRVMRTLFVMSLICALSCLVALAALSAMTVVPAAQATNDRAMLIAAALSLGWVGVAVWAGLKLRAVAVAAHRQTSRGPLNPNSGSTAAPKACGVRKEIR